MQRPRARLLGLFAASVLLAAGAMGAPYLWRWVQYLGHERTAVAREPAAIAAWRDTYGDPGARAAGFIRTKNNPTAERLVVLAKPLGFTLENWPHAASDFPEASAIGRYVNAAGDLTEPTVRAYLDGHRADIAPIVDLLTTTEQPKWNSTVSPPLPVPEPRVSLLGLRLLNNVLVAQALFDASEGRRTDADRAMQAAWQVMRSSRDQPLLIGQLISLALTTADLGAVRMTANAEAWRDRLEDYDYAAGLKRSIEMEVVQRVLIADSSRARRAFLADYVDGMRANLERLDRVRLTDDPSVTFPFNAPKYPAVAPGTVTAEIGWPQFVSSYRQSLCTMLSVELTERVLEARQAKAKTGHWPETLPEVQSAVVADAHWVYRAGPNDLTSISLNRSTPSCQASLTSFKTSR